MQSETLFKEALQLSPLDKVKLMELLFDSFHANLDQTEHEQQWAHHAEQICDRIDQNKMPMHTVESVLSELNQ
ncbi:MAG: addiction module protein [Hydrogenovibrio sp.]|uniref:addiction module protein n=1 Tax=Hydrogenovibrio TaxID=28884 RepID=UPI00036F45B0|nr:MULTISPECIES: addiction module protein [Hydrogenovibrio]MDR9498175.1 addiction module protein [Hydrogenovibrio sp.]